MSCVRYRPSARVRRDAGIAIGPILFIIAILGVLAAAIAAGGGAFSSSTSSESANAAAQAIVDYGEQVQNGVDLMLGRGVDPLNLSFTHRLMLQNGALSSDTWDQNPNCTNDTCELFKPSGGGVVAHSFHIYGTTDPSWLPGYSEGGGLVFQAKAITGVGTSASDLVMMISGIREDVCVQINKLLGYTVGAQSGSGSAYDWNGAIPSNVWTLGQTYTGANGARRFCYDSGTYGIYHVVLIVN